VVTYSQDPGQGTTVTIQTNRPPAGQYQYQPNGAQPPYDNRAPNNYYARRYGPAPLAGQDNDSEV